MTMYRPAKPQRDARIDALGNDDRSVLILKDILRDFNRDMQSVYETIGPISAAVAPITGAGGAVGLATEPLDFVGQTTLLNIYLSWTAPGPAARTYEIRRSDELNWVTASFVTRTPSLTVNLDPLPTGSYYFLIKSIDLFGNYSTNFASTIVTVIPPGTPTVAASVIDNNVLLSWTVPTASFMIDRYRIYRNGILFGTTRATFSAAFETVAGTYTYGIEPVDIAGNVGGTGYVTVSVNTPPDYQLQDRRYSNFDGTMHNVLRLSNSLLACVDRPEVWNEHFIEDSWDQPSDQTEAGYPVYIQPTELTGWYEEVIDYELEIQNTIVTVTYQLAQIIPEVDVTVLLAYSSDGIVYSPFVAGYSQFIPTFRYLKLRIEFTAHSDKALAELTILQITLDVKREVDGGEIIALASDVEGTIVYFNKTFKDVNSITATADSIEPIIIIYDFVDIPDPTFFKVYALDSTGNRVTYLVSWKARGIV